MKKTKAKCPHPKPASHHSQDALQGYKRSLLLGGFLDSGRAPRMVDVEVAVQLGFSESKFQAYAKEGRGRIVSIPSPRGLGTDRLPVWVSNEVGLAREEAPVPEPSS